MALIRPLINDSFDQTYIFVIDFLAENQWEFFFSCMGIVLINQIELFYSYHQAKGSPRFILLSSSHTSTHKNLVHPPVKTGIGGNYVDLQILVKIFPSRLYFRCRLFFIILYFYTSKPLTLHSLHGVLSSIYPNLASLKYALWNIFPS